MASPPSTAILYFDLASPYAYLAVERVESVIGAVELEPILLGAIFKRRGFGSWAGTGERADKMAEIEARARRYGLPPLVWPDGWPLNSLAANRAATWAKLQGAVRPFSRLVYRREFAEGGQIASPNVLSECADQAGLDPEQLPAAIERREIKDALRGATDRGWALGVRGVPSIVVDGVVFYGDDRLEEAAAYLAASPGFAAG